MILNGSDQVLLNLKKTTAKNQPGTREKLGVLNVINQLQSFILCNMMCYGAIIV